MSEEDLENLNEQVNNLVWRFGQIQSEMLSMVEQLAVLMVSVRMIQPDKKDDK